MHLFVQQYLGKRTLERQAYTVVGYDKGRLKEERELDESNNFTPEAVACDEVRLFKLH